MKHSVEKSTIPRIMNKVYKAAGTGRTKYGGGWRGRLSSFEESEIKNASAGKLIRIERQMKNCSRNQKFATNV
jgi:hypothetical protein